MCAREKREMDSTIGAQFLESRNFGEVILLAMFEDKDALRSQPFFTQDHLRKFG